MFLYYFVKRLYIMSSVGVDFFITLAKDLKFSHLSKRLLINIERGYIFKQKSLNGMNSPYQILVRFIFGHISEIFNLTFNFFTKINAFKSWRCVLEIHFFLVSNPIYTIQKYWGTKFYTKIYIFFDLDRDDEFGWFSR